MREREAFACERLVGETEPGAGATLYLRIPLDFDALRVNNPLGIFLVASSPIPSRRKSPDMEHERQKIGDAER
jgi:hypothetical protein